MVRIIVDSTADLRPETRQRVGVVPGFAPEPEQVGQLSSRGIRISFFTPKAASSNDIVT